MKKTVAVIATIIFLVAGSIYALNSKKTESTSSDVNVEGMKVTMLGAGNMKENSNTNSCGYVIRNANGKLIMVDGGLKADAQFVLDYINEFGNGVVDYWFITHPHSDHVGALTTILESEEITINNLCYSFNSKEWYEANDKRGWESESKMIDSLSSAKILNKIECEKNQVINIDNIRCDIIRVANPEITSSDNGNESSMTFKFTATDVNKSMIFLGDSFKYASIELLENPEALKADVVQMAHHGQNGVTKEVYQAIAPQICCFNAPEWLYNNDIGTGYNTGKWQSIEVRGWVEELGASSILAYEGDKTLSFTSHGIEY